MPTQQFSQPELLREAVATYLATVAEFAGVGVLTRKEKDIVSLINAQIGEVGLAVEIYIKHLHLDQSQSEIVQYNPLVLGLAVYENTLINQDPDTGTGKGAYWLMEAALVALKLWAPPGYGNEFMPDAAGPQIATSEKQPLLFIVTQDFSTTLALAPRTTA